MNLKAYLHVQFQGPILHKASAFVFNIVIFPFMKWQSNAKLDSLSKVNILVSMSMDLFLFNYWGSCTIWLIGEIKWSQFYQFEAEKIKGGIIKSHNEFTILNAFQRGEEKFTATGKGIHGILSFFDYGSFSPISDWNASLKYVLWII
jgi:hypothetical protein